MSCDPHRHEIKHCLLPPAASPMPGDVVVEGTQLGIYAPRPVPKILNGAPATISASVLNQTHGSCLERDKANGA